MNTKLWIGAETKPNLWIPVCINSAGPSLLWPSVGGCWAGEMTGDCRLQGHFMAPLCAADSRSCRRITSAPLIMILQWIFILQHVWPAVYIMCRDVTRRSCDTLAQLWPAAVTLLPRDHCDVSHQYLGRPQDDAAEPRAYATQTRGRGLLSHFRPGLGLTMNVMGDKNIFSNV